MLDVDKVFVLHVKKGYEDRATHIESILGKLGIPFEYMLDGDISDFTESRLKRYFTTDFTKNKAGTSCALKHFLIYEKIVSDNLNRVLILEDDVYLHKNFTDLFNRSVDEFKTRTQPNEAALVFYETSHLRFIPRSQRVKGQMLYPTNRIQCTATYCINNTFARKVLETSHEYKCCMPFDWYLDSLKNDRNLFTLYQSFPTLSEQGTHTGKMASSIGNPLGANLKWVFLKRKLSTAYKSLLSEFR